MAGHDPAALHQYTMLLECLQVGGELAPPTLQQRAQLGECQYSSTGEKIMDLQTHTHTQPVSTNTAVSERLIPG